MLSESALLVQGFIANPGACATVSTRKTRLRAPCQVQMGTHKLQNYVLRQALYWPEVMDKLFSSPSSLALPIFNHSFRPLSDDEYSRIPMFVRSKKEIR